MDIVSANYDLVKKVLDRYEKTGCQKVDIYLTHHKYVKGEGHGRCFKIKTDDTQVELLEEHHLFKYLESPSPNINCSTIFTYHGDFYLKEARDWYDKEDLKRKTKPDWGWHKREKGEYKFGKEIFHQGGKKIRKKLFQSLMDLYEKSPRALSVKSLCEMTGLDPRRLRIEISAINQRLKKQIKLYFKGSGQGFYTLEVFIIPTKSSVTVSN